MLPILHQLGRANFLACSVLRKLEDFDRLLMFTILYSIKPTTIKNYIYSVKNSR